ncbi:AAA family ATPase [Moorena sp. SIO4G3]|uniref:McrB family protein n=1 Tax=Moorena sp. SIO4G3 TaxID=2607821 RepID=UPI00142C4F40|nr:AAA family ATPase [Moorena sp. SIO4G3]NEO75646.1 AAA domain-containing protein [Moorena sp. SIO4G3]
MVGDKKAELVSLFQEFISSYPYTPVGLSHMATYKEQRRLWCRNFEAISAIVESGEAITEPILFQLFPDRELAITLNSQYGEGDDSWILTIPRKRDNYLELRLPLKLKYHHKWIQRLVEQIGYDILEFVGCCTKHPNQLSAACDQFSTGEYSKGFPTEMLTNLLNGLQPDRFLLINDNSRQVINYFVNTSYGKRLIDYPAANAAGLKLIKALDNTMHQPGVPVLRDNDLFDMFCYWLVAVKGYNFSGKEEVTVYSSDASRMKLPEEYTVSECARDTGFDIAELEGWIRAIERKGQGIFYGPPGTGKTYSAQKIANHLISGSDGFTELVQFHPAYSYEDFIQGIRPQSQNGELRYPLLPGRFLEFCNKAESRRGICVLIIDEINRANLASVFGELLYLLEYRDQKIPLAGSNQLFSIPKNVRIIGTMNTADRSIALVDQAFRRRFAFIRLYPNYEILRRYHETTDFPVNGLIKILEQINNAIADPNYSLGISFFLIETIAEEIEDIWQREIEPYLEEYFFDQRDKLDQFRWDTIKVNIKNLN